jgi:ribonuclease E
MVERPIDEEPPIAETEAAEEAKPAPAKRSRRKKDEPRAETIVSEPAPAETPPAKAADQAAPADKPARKRRSKKAEAAPAEPEPVPAAEPKAVPAANNDTSEEETGEPRRGWWQRTFG